MEVSRANSGRRDSSGPLSQVRDRFEAPRDERRPSRLVTRADPATVLAVEILVEEHQVPELGPTGVNRLPAMHRTASVRSGEEEAIEPRREVACDLVEIREPPRA